LVCGDGTDDYSHPIITATAMREKNSLLRRDEGATAVEGALVISVLMFLIFGIVEFGMALWAWNTMGLAVQDAGRYAMVNNGYPNNPPGCTGTLASCAVDQMQTSLASSPGTVSTTC